MLEPTKGVIRSESVPNLREISAEWDDFFADPNVTSVGLGRKYRAGEETDELCVSVGVVRKMPMRNVAKGLRIPKLVKGRDTGVEMPTDVIATGEYVADQAPVAPGRRCDVVGAGGVGTAGAFVTDGAGRVHILSNNHVIADGNRSAIGDDVRMTYNGAFRAVADLTRFEPINFGRDNVVDAAIARLRAGVNQTPNIAGIGNPSGLGYVRIGTSVRKRGQTTGLTSGRVTRLFVSARINYSNMGLPTAQFRNLIEMSKMSSPGDSGSVYVDSSRRIVGLNFAGSSSRSLACSIASVWHELNLYGFDLGGAPLRGALIFADKSFRGRSTVVHRTLGDSSGIGFGDNVSSIRILGGSAIFYEHDSFRGRALYVETSLADTHRVGFGDNISSVRTYSSPLSGATLYSDKGYRGRSTFIRDRISDLHGIGMGDRISSVRLHRGARLRLFEHKRYRGRSIVLTRSDSDIHDRSFGDKASSARIE